MKAGDLVTRMGPDVPGFITQGWQYIVSDIAAQTSPVAIELKGLPARWWWQHDFAVATSQPPTPATPPATSTPLKAGDTVVAVRDVPLGYGKTALAGTRWVIESISPGGQYLRFPGVQGGHDVCRFSVAPPTTSQNYVESIITRDDIDRPTDAQKLGRAVHDLLEEQCWARARRIGTPNTCASCSAPLPCAYHPGAA